MDKYILEDSISQIVDFYKKQTAIYMNPPRFEGYSRRGRFLFERMVVVSDANPLGKLFLPVISQLKAKKLIQDATSYFVEEAIPLFETANYDSVAIKSINELKSAEAVNKCVFSLCIDCERVANKEQWFSAIKEICEYAKKGKNNKCTIVLLLPSIPVIPDENIESLAERELSYFMECKVSNLTPAQQFFNELEALCRSIVAGGFTSLNVVRVDNLIGPEACQIKGFDLEAHVAKAFEEGRVEISTEDNIDVFSASYIVDAINFSLLLSYNGGEGQIYNFKSFDVTKAEIKQTLWSLFKDRLAISNNSGKVDKQTFRCVNTLKNFKAKFKPDLLTPLSNAIYRIACNIANVQDNNKKNIEIYSGKLKRIKELELMMLKDIDALCEKHGIKYFLCGGTMLGAVRYGHSIPWDDDLDIGMLRKDFDKFRKVLSKEHKDIYNYSSHWNKSGSHYIVDKIRLNGTYFSTKYSSVHEFPDGLFIDVLVYDQTSDYKFIGKVHSCFVLLFSKIIEVLWFGHPRRNQYYGYERLALPFLRLFPMGFYHWIFEHLLTLFKYKKNPKYVIDSTGKLQYKGSFSIEGLQDVKRVPFDGGFMAPIPEDTKNYLTFDYGPNYLPEPPLTKRCAPHDFARIDLGEHIFETHECPEFRDVNIRGELFEQEK